MKRALICCVRKDMTEYLRGKKNILFCLTILSLGAMVLLATLYLPDLIAALVAKMPDMVSDPDSVSQSLSAFFPGKLKENMGVFASDIAVFYGIVVILSCYNLVPEEIHGGKWIFPLSAGYKPMTLIFSKGIVYGGGAALPVVAFYNLYYFVGATLLDYNMAYPVALLNSLVLGFAVFSMVYLAVILSVLCKKPVTGAVSLLLVVLAGPDILYLFSFGKFFPTHLLTFVYEATGNVAEIAIPLGLTLLLEVGCTLLAAHKAANIEAAR